MDVRQMRIFAAEQIDVPDAFPGILKNFIKEVVRQQPEEMVTFSRQYFETLLKARADYAPDQSHRIELNPKEYYLSHNDNIKDHYDLFEIIGEGALSRVRRGVQKNSGITRAIKVVRKEDLEFGERRKLLEEIELLKQLDHPNIGQVHEMYEDKKKIYFVNEMMHGGSLYERVTADQHFNEIKAANVIKQLFSAINYLHQSNIVHGDVKPQNIHFKDQEDTIIKLIDFGTSRRVNEQHAMHGVFGTSYYIAPEVIDGTYSEKCDVWSIGIILYILLSGEPPFNGQTDQDIVDRIREGEYSFEGDRWAEISDQAKDLITRILCKESERMSAAEAFQHPWFEMIRQLEKEIDGGAAYHQREQNVARALANLKSFSSKNLAKQAALGYLIQHFLNVNDQVELQQVFADLDTSANGTITRKELLDGYRKHFGADFDEQRVDNLISMADSSGDGCIQLQEFMMTCVDHEKFLTLQRLEQIFAELDVDNNHMISLQELDAFLGRSEHLNKESLQQAFEEVDPEGTGEIDFAQFQQLITNLLE